LTLLNKILNEAYFIALISAIGLG